MSETKEENGSEGQTDARRARVEYWVKLLKTSLFVFTFFSRVGTCTVRKPFVNTENEFQRCVILS